MIENIGKVKLDLTFYSGEDLYSDGEVESELLNIVQHYKESELPAIIEKDFNWPILYHLSMERENILRWYPFEEGSTVLEIGSGCGAITGCLCKRSKKVVAIELSKRRSLINAYRHKNFTNLSIIVANFNDVYEKINERFNYVTLIGVLEYANNYINEKDAFYKLLKRASSLLTENGKLIIAIENRLGLKYFAGCKEDHLGTLFSGIEGYSDNRHGVKTFDKVELEKLLLRAEFENNTFYYPYPDYKFADTIYSDIHLPRKGELVSNIRNFDNNRLVLFDESKVFDSLVDSKLFPVFSNSFLVVAKRKG